MAHRSQLRLRFIGTIDVRDHTSRATVRNGIVPRRESAYHKVLCIMDALMIMPEVY